MSKEENTPILLVPAFRQYPGQQPVSYGVVHIDTNPVQRRTQKEGLFSGGITSGPVLAIIGIIVGIILIFSLAHLYSNTYGEYVVIYEPNGPPAHAPVLQQSAPSAVLGQSAPTGSYFDITIRQGQLRGYLKTSRQGRGFAAFYKVPYASPPIGDMRFKDTEPPTSWTGLRDNAEVATQCIQLEKYPTTPGAIYAVGDEDCLYANIYVPSSGSIVTTPTYPVMMYVHGGGVSGNGSRYGAEYFMDEDVILVTFNYRLGPLGNLNTGDDVIRGNMGFKDMVQMMKWIRDNIQSFGGDPGRVTIFANSAGGMNVGYLTVSPLTQGLFHRAVSQSGGTVCGKTHGMVVAKPEDSVGRMGRAVNCSTTSSTELLNCLKTKPASDLAVALLGAPYLLTVEDRPNPVEGSVFMPDTPYNLLSQGKAHPVPHIYGNTNAEWLGSTLDVLDNATLLAELNEDFGKHGGEILNIGDSMTSEDLMKIKEFYFGTESIGNATLLPLEKLVSDNALDHCCYLSARLHAKVAKSYLYWLTKPPAKSYVDKPHPGYPAEALGFVAHADELQFQFPYYPYPEIPTTDEKHYEFSKYFIKLWAHFAATGDTTLDGVTWPSVDPDKTENIVWLELGDTPRQTTTILDRMQFWDKFTHEQLDYV